MDSEQKDLSYKDNEDIENFEVYLPLNIYARVTVIMQSQGKGRFYKTIWDRLHILCTQLVSNVCNYCEWGKLFSASLHWSTSVQDVATEHRALHIQEYYFTDSTDHFWPVDRKYCYNLTKKVHKPLEAELAGDIVRLECPRFPSYLVLDSPVVAGLFCPAPGLTKSNSTARYSVFNMEGRGGCAHRVLWVPLSLVLLYFCSAPTTQ